MDFETMKSANKNAVDIQHKQAEHFNDIYDEAVNYFLQCKKIKTVTQLRRAADKFIEAIEFKSTHPGPYLYLARIFYILGRDEMASDYLKTAEAIDPGFTGLQEFKLFINKKGPARVTRLSRTPGF
jgi:hypothetical protein